jgi:acyl-coenzyme A synthetase/AMP-(fatty) acid ligase
MPTEAQMTRSASDPTRPGRLIDMVSTPQRRQAFLNGGLWDASTLVRRVEEHAARRGQQIAVVDRGGARRATYSQLNVDSSLVASMLLEAGVESGDVVAVQLPNWYETVVVAIGILRVGAVINPMLPIYRSKEMRHMLAAGNTKVAFTPAEYRDFDHVAMMDDIRSDLPALRRHIVVDASATGPDAFWNRLAAQGSTQQGLPAEAGNVSELIFTSGTEAEPKAIMHTEQTANFSVRAAFSSLSMTEQDVVWMPSPIGHSTGFNYGVRMALYHGLKLVLQDRWDGVQAASIIESEGCTYTLAATTFLRDLVQASRSGQHRLLSLRLFGSGGAPVPAELVRDAMEVGIGALRLYGSTEVLVGTWNRPSSPVDKKVHTDGAPVDNVSVQIWTDDGRQDVRDEPGEIYTRGPNTCVGFYNDPVRTASTFMNEGWVKSGDLGVIDRDGYLTVVGRKKEIIIRGGLNVAPREVEELLLKMKGVNAVAVVGLPHERLGEIGCACVVLQDGVNLSLGEVIEHLKEAGLATYKFPERLEMVSALPMTSTGKIRKHELVAAILARRSVTTDER